MFQLHAVAPCATSMNMEIIEPQRAIVDYAMQLWLSAYLKHMKIHFLNELLRSLLPGTRLSVHARENHAPHTLVSETPATAFPSWHCPRPVRHRRSVTAVHSTGRLFSSQIDLHFLAGIVVRGKIRRHRREVPYKTTQPLSTSAEREGESELARSLVCEAENFQKKRKRGVVIR